MPMQPLEGCDDNELETEFDEEWYRSEYPDVDATGLEPIEHFRWIGRKLGRHPRPADASGRQVESARAEEVAKLAAPSLPVSAVQSQELPPMPALANRWAPNSMRIGLNGSVELAPLWRTFNPDSLNLHWLISSVRRGDVRLDFVFGLIAQLEHLGHSQTVWILGGDEPFDADAVFARISEWYVPLGKTVVRKLPVDAEGISGDAVIATDSWASFAAAAMPLFKGRFQLVCEPESEFNLSDPTSSFAGHGFRAGMMSLLPCVELATSPALAGYWTRAIGRPGRQASDPDLLSKSNLRERGQRLACYIAEDSSEQVVELALLALAEFDRLGQGIEVVFTGRKTIGGALNFKYSAIDDHGHQARMAAYDSCFAGLIISTAGWTAAAFEMAAAGLPLVAFDTSQSRLALAGLEVTFTAPNPRALVDSLLDIMSAPAGRFATNSALNGWDECARRTAAVLIEGLSENNEPAPAARLLAEVRYPNRAAVIIPTWNAGDLFRDVLSAVTSQKTRWPFEVLVVDSGSSDNTLEIVDEFSDRGVRRHAIPNSEFQHGRTRNLAISMTEAEFVAVITQDATPANATWLSNLVAAFDAGKRVAGVFGAHEAYEEATPFTKGGISGHFEHFGRLPQIAEWGVSDDGAIRFGSLGWQQWLHYYSDNNSCMRRSVWEKIPYPEIDWGEDQVWAWEIVKQGYQKAFAKDAIVLHSHNLTYHEQFKVSKTEGQFWMRHFGYRFEDNPEWVTASVDYLNKRDQVTAHGKGIALSLLEEQMGLNRAGVTGRYVGQVEYLARLHVGRD